MANNYEYLIKFEDDSEKKFNVSIDPQTRLISDDDNEEGPEWTKLEFKQCPHCPYQKGEKVYCPVAKNLAKASEAFKSERSFVQLNAFVRADERLYGKKTDLQTALFSLFGLIMASSNCAHLKMFRSVARFHLPFSTIEETYIRIFGAYLIFEYLKTQNNPDHKISLTLLSENYHNINIVNQSIMERIRAISDGDASKNAIIILDGFCTLLPMEVESGLSEIRALFSGVEF